jgi:hypothetical protein
MNKYSPGPWHVEAAHPKFIGDVRCDVYPPQDLPMGSRIPVATSIHPENARLIAAAPDLLAALQDIVEYLGEDVDNGLDELLTNARAAIATAKGQ